jgi:hypothetical protein
MPLFSVLPYLLLFSLLVRLMPVVAEAAAEVAAVESPFHVAV